jgi:serine/threonine protein kinase
MSAIKEYEVEKEVIGSGSFGFVKKAKRKDGKEVAIKFLMYNPKEEKKLNSFLKEVYYNI